MIVPEYILELTKDLDISNRKSFGRNLVRVLDDKAKKWLQENDVTVRQLRWLIENKAETIPVCPICGKKIAYEHNKKWCSAKCASRSDEVKNKRIQTSIEKYGVANPMQCEEIRSKSEQTCLEKYGVRNAFQSEEIKKKIVETHLSNLGVEWPMQSKEILEKSKETCLEKYGCEWSLQSKEVREKGKETLISRYGVDIPAKSKAIQEKTKRTCLERYGVEVPVLCEQVYNKIKRTCIEKYGTENPMQNKEVSRQTTKTKRVKRLNVFLTQLDNNQLVSLSDVEKLISGRKWNCRCNRCGNVFETQGMNIQTTFCRNCSQKRSSNAESEFAYIISNLSPYNIKRNVYNIIGLRKEIDVYVPELNLGFEYNGSYWHSSKFAIKTRHQEKVMNAIDKDIHLVTIFDWQWNSYRKIVEDTIKRALDVGIKHIDGNLCCISSMKMDDFVALQKNNSLKTLLVCEESFSIYYNDEIVGAIGKNKNNDVYFYEVVGNKIDNIENILNKIGFNTIIVDLAFDNIKEWKIKGYVIDEIIEPQKYIINNRTLNEATNDEIIKDRCFTVYSCGMAKLKSLH